MVGTRNSEGVHSYNSLKKPDWSKRIQEQNLDGDVDELTTSNVTQPVTSLDRILTSLRASLMQLVLGKLP